MVKKKKIKIDTSKWNLSAMERNMEKFLGIKRKEKRKRIFRPESQYISR